MLIIILKNTHTMLSERTIYFALYIYSLIDITRIDSSAKDLIDSFNSIEVVIVILEKQESFCIENEFQSSKLNI